MTFTQALANLIEEYREDVPMQADAIFIAELVVSILTKVELFVLKKDGYRE
jgi:hypothetical protein